MIILRCTQMLLKDMKIKPDQPEEESAFFSWHANIYTLYNRKHIAFMNDLSRMTIIVDGVRSGQPDKLKSKFCEALTQSLNHEQIAADQIDAYLRHASELVVAKSNSRSVLATMNVVGYFPHADYPVLIDFVHQLNHLIYEPIDYKQPIDVFKEALRSHV